MLHRKFLLKENKSLDTIQKMKRGISEDFFSLANDNMASSKKYKRPSTKRPRDPEEARAIKLRKIARDLGVVSARKGRTRSSTHKQASLAKIQAIARYRHRRSLLNNVSLNKIENQNISNVF